MRLRATAFVAALLIGGSGLGGHAQAPATTTDIPRLAFETYTLPNGLKVILSPDRRLPLVAVNIWYHVGPANEEPGRTGFAHLFEHMMFQGSKHVPADAHFKLLEGAGATDINGTTDFDRTNYFETLPSNELELALWLESDRMGYLLEQVTQPALSNQQDVVRNERRQGVENQPYGIVEEEMIHAVYPKGHPYYASVIGSHADLQAVKLEDVRNFFKQYYSPNNASLAIVGDFDTSEVKRLVEKYFGTIKRGPDVKKPNVTTPPITAEKRLVVKDTVELPKVYMTWISPEIFKEGDADATIAASILGTGKSSRLYKTLVYEKQIAQTVQVRQYSLILGSMFGIEVTARPGHTADEIESAIDAELDKLRTAGVDQKEVERARNGIETDIIGGLERLGGFGGVADRLNSYEHYLGNPGYLAQDVERYRRVTPASVKAFADKYLQKNSRVVVFGVPGQKELAPEVPKTETAAAAGAAMDGVNADEPWRKEQPKAGPLKPLQLGTPASFKLANGLTVLLAERKGLPVVAATLVVRTGSDANPPDMPGLANFTAAMLDEGTSTRNALQIADEVAQYGATLGTASTMDSSSVVARSLTKNFGPVLVVMADVAQRPSFPQEEIDRQRASRLATLVQQRENPSIVAQRALYASLYGPKHPYGYMEIGTEASNKAVTGAAMQAFWKQNFVPNNAALIVAGGITEAELKPLVEKAFGAWQPGTPAKPALGAPETTSAKLVIVDKPGAPQTQLWVGAIGAPRATPDYAALQVANNVFGGLFSSRLNMNLREDKGYSYGAFSAFLFRKAAGPFIAGAGVKTDVTAESVREMLKEAAAMAAPPKPQELTLAKDSIVRSLPGDFETSQNAAGSLANIYIYDLGLDYYSKYPATIEAVNAAAAEAVAKKYMDPGRLIVVAVGDRAKIEPAIAKIDPKLGAPQIRDADGNLVK
jgi:zinc protease